MVSFFLVEQFYYILFSVSPHPLGPDAYGWEDAVFVPLAERVWMHLEHIGRLRKCQKLGNLTIFVFILIHVDFYLPFDTIILQQMAPFSKVCWG